jgi:hypothetical protein
MGKLATLRKVHFIGKNKQEAILHGTVVHYPVELEASLVNPPQILAVHNKDQCLRTDIIMSPKRPDFILTTNVLKEKALMSAGNKHEWFYPDIKLDIFHHQAFDIETNSRNSCDRLIKF